ncbi:uncharacterized protein LOC142344541 [Convolutriloba macropyga]|uniref:uncharacterized protein LOC142344541 n=1 Tax=Convolutriloba macropyga TaxID=536237 RepID=UPI003F5228EB
MCNVVFVGEYATESQYVGVVADLNQLVVFIFLVQIAVFVIALAAYLAFRDNYKKRLYFTAKHRAIAVNRSKDMVFDWRHPIWHKNFFKEFRLLSQKQFAGLVKEYERFDEDQFPFVATVSGYDRRLKTKNDQHPLHEKARILPYESTLVRLGWTCDYTEDPLVHLCGGYVNASYFKGAFNRNKVKYVSTAHPKNWDGVEDFWRLIWDTRVPVVVMLEGYTNSGNVMCAAYLPKNDTMPLYVHQFTLMQKGAVEQSKSFQDKRTITILNRQTVEKRETLVLQYPYFPVNGDLSKVGEVLDFVLFVRNSFKPPPGKQSTEILTHCPNGSRSCGLYIASDRLVQEAASREYSDVMGCVADLRLCRKDVIPIIHQYRFLYQLVLQFLTKHKQPSSDKQNQLGFLYRGDDLEVYGGTQADAINEQIDPNQIGKTGEDDQPPSDGEHFRSLSPGKQNLFHLTNKSWAAVGGEEEPEEEEGGVERYKRRKRRRRRRVSGTQSERVLDTIPETTGTTGTRRRRRSRRATHTASPNESRDRGGSSSKPNRLGPSPNEADELYLEKQEDEEEKKEEEDDVEGELLPSHGLRPRPLHVAASEIRGREFKPTDFSRSRRYSARPIGETPTSFMQTARDKLNISKLPVTNEATQDIVPYNLRQPETSATATHQPGTSSSAVPKSAGATAASTSFVPGSKLARTAKERRQQRLQRKEAELRQKIEEEQKRKLLLEQQHKEQQRQIQEAENEGLKVTADDQSVMEDYVNSGDFSDQFPYYQ